MKRDNIQIWPVVGEYHDGKQVYVKCLVANLKTGVSIKALYYCDRHGEEIEYKPEVDELNFDFAK